MHPFARHFYRCSRSNTPVIHLFSRQCTALSLFLLLPLLSLLLFFLLSLERTLSKRYSSKRHVLYKIIVAIGFVIKYHKEKHIDTMTMDFFVLTSASLIKTKNIVDFSKLLLRVEWELVTNSS